MRILLTFICALMLFPQFACASGYFEYQTNTIAAGYSWNAKSDIPYGNGNPSGNVYNAQFEHFDENKWGRNWFDVEGYFGKEMSDSPSQHTDSITYINPAFSFNKITNSHFKLGPITDVMASLRVEKSNYGGFEANNAGVLFTLNIPGFQYFETDFYVRKMRYRGNPQKEPNFFGRFFYVANPWNFFDLFKIHNMATFVYNARRDGFNDSFFMRQDFFVYLDKKRNIDAGLRVDFHSFRKPAFLGTGRRTLVVPRLMIRMYL